MLLAIMIVGMRDCMMMTTMTPTRMITMVVCCHQQDVYRRWCFLVIREACVPTCLQRYKFTSRAVCTLGTSCEHHQDVYDRWCPPSLQLLGPAVRNRNSPQHFLVVCCHQQDVYRRWCPPSLELPFLQSLCFRCARCHQQDVNRRWCFLVIRPVCVPTRLQRYKLREQELLDPECNRMQ